MEWIFCFRKGNKRSIKIEKHILPYQMQRTEQTRKVQKVLRTLCDREDDESSSEKSLVAARFTQKIDTKNRTNHNTNSVQQKIIDLTDSSSEDSFLSYERNKQNRSKRDQKVKSVRNFNDRSTHRDSRLIIKEKNTSKRYQVSSDSNDSTDSSETNARKYTSKHNIKSEIVKRKTNRVYLSDSESDEINVKRASNISKKISKARQRNKNMDNKKSMDKTKKHSHYLTSESENEECKRRHRENTKTNQMTSYINNDERKHKSLTKSLSNIQEDDSDNSSSKEFQKIKLQKVNRKYSMKVLVDLDIDHTKSPCMNNSANDKSKKYINEQSNQNLNDIKKILEDCKKVCSNFQMYIETIEQLYGRKDEEQLILKSTEKIDKLRTVLEKKQKDLTTSYQLWSKNRKKSGMRRSYKVISDDKESSEEGEKCTESENKRISGDEQDINKTVSECDSEEIFSANETGTLQKTQATQCKADTSRTENSLNKDGTNIDNEDKMLVDESKNNDKNDMNTQDDLASSPVLGTLKEKNDIERSMKKLFSECNKSNETQLTNESSNTNNTQTSLSTDNETEMDEDSPSRDSHKKKTENDETHQSNERNIINESMDMFDTSLENAEESRSKVKIETNYDKEEFLHASKNKFSNSCESSLQDTIPTEKERISLSPCDIGEEKDLSSSRLNQGDQEKTAFVITEAHNSKTSGKTNTDDNESLDDAEALAKKALLATDSDTSDTLDNENVAKLTEDLITNDTDRTEKKNEMEDNDSDVNSVSTVMLSTRTKEVNTDAEKDTTIDTENEIKVEKKNDNRLDKRSRQEISSSDEDGKAEKAAKKALLESNSDDSTLLSSELEKLTDKASESDCSEKNAKAKRSLLASFSESSSFELLPLSETVNISKNTKYNHEPESEKASIATRLKKRKLQLDKNCYYKNDKKLRMSCQVQLTRLNAKVLRCHSHALRISREYLEHKALKRYRELSVKRMSIVLQRLI